MSIGEYIFSAIKGRQAGREFYISMCPLKLVPRLFLFQGEGLPPELRSQRILNKARIPEISRYIMSNRQNYIFSAITASIDRHVTFEKLVVAGKELEDIGKLRIPLDACFLLNDGQHRRAAIEDALREQPDLGDETISVVFFIDKGLKHSQQMFADLNKHAVRPTRSIGILFDHRDPLSNLACEVVEKVPIFRNLTEMEKTSISNRSTKLFTLSGIYQGTLSLLRKSEKIKNISDVEMKIVLDFWTCVTENMRDWKLAANKQISSFELRQDYVHAHALALHAIGRLGADLLSTPGRDYKKDLKKLDNIDWARKNRALWEGRAMYQGKISKSHLCVTLTTNYLKNVFKLPLSPEESQVEQDFLKKT
ncbi:MAG: DNA sulfur modification protein DndB [Proteobacteria bacterium]|nr:DNA sulfur modification protein DndB [Pseudomonadota bacterium]MBU4259085.1 DNA sulfur modification protein DndB [Pseudomonadota bacterium]MBU4288771.1 DNA sulfur modification protein DndB [Pseudomonadota bacterium]